jgi:predicted nucleic acid-binding protein
VSYLLDTNVISEATKRQPSAGVQSWLAAQSNDSLFLSAITLGEIRRGLLLLEAGKKKRTLLRWLNEEIKPVFASRILPVDTAVMEHWAQLQATSEKAGRRLPAMDSLIAATALAHGLILATRNTADFQSTKVPLLNPWQDAQ